MVETFLSKRGFQINLEHTYFLINILDNLKIPIFLIVVLTSLWIFYVTFM